MITQVQNVEGDGGLFSPVTNNPSVLVLQFSVLSRYAKAGSLFYDSGGAIVTCNILNQVTVVVVE